ncbi:polymer-forming cytoskeletal protein [bacterium]|nr:polymer-forming cytoskeletal protein [bacterium]
MFNKAKRSSEEAIDARNHVAAGTLLKGTIESQGGLRIDGRIEGEVEAIGKLVIGEKGEIKGNITCKDAEIEGKVNGNINSSGLLYLKQSAVIHGDITAHLIKMDPGAVFIGQSDMRSASQQAPSLNGQKVNNEKVNKDSKAKAVQ